MSALRSWFSSVRGRITIVVTVVFALVMVLGGWFILNRAESAWIDDIEARDLAELEMLAADLQAFEIIGDGVVLPVGVDGTSFTLMDSSGALIGATPVDVFSGGVIVEGVLPEGAVPDVVIDRMMAGDPSVAMLGDVTTVTLDVSLDQGVVTLAAMSSLQPVEAGVDALRDILWLLVPLLALGVGATTWFVTGRAFQPVAAITAQVERIADGRLDERVPVPDTGDEVAHLASTMNTMLDRLRSSRRRQQEFVSDASHELRNPVATSKVKLEVALAHPDDVDWEETATVVLEEQERLGRMVDDLLLLARIDEGQALDRQEVDLDDIVFIESGRSLGVIVDVTGVRPTRIQGDQRQLTQLVRNLIDNAARHANTRIFITLREAGERALLSVEDDGRGIASQDRERVFERFVRLEDARTRDEGGAGLGLALVAAVAQAHGGGVVAGQAKAGGARFEISLPVA